MKLKINLELVMAVIFAVFAIACAAAAVIFGAWWHMGTSAMSACLAWVLGRESQEEEY